MKRNLRGQERAKRVLHVRWSPYEGGRRAAEILSIATSSSSESRTPKPIAPRPKNQHQTSTKKTLLGSKLSSSGPCRASESSGLQSVQGLSSACAPRRRTRRCSCTCRKGDYRHISACGRGHRRLAIIRGSRALRPSPTSLLGISRTTAASELSAGLC
jgi:hypothetical protein